jgi:hypothetical protein
MYTNEQFGLHFSFAERICATDVSLLRLSLQNTVRNLPGFHSGDYRDWFAGHVQTWAATIIKLSLLGMNLVF